MWDFIENASVDDIENVPDEHKPYYEEDKATKKFVLKADVVPLAQSLTNTQKNLARAVATRKEDSKKDATRRTVLDGIKAILPEIGVEVDDDDITKLPEVIKTKVTELVEAGKNGKDNKVNIENVKKAMEVEKTKLIDNHKREMAAMESSLTEYLIDSVATSELAKADTIDSGLELLLPKIRASVKVVKTEDGKYVPRVIDTDGTYKFNSKGTEMSVADVVGEMRTKFPNMFKSKETGGGGTRTATHQANNKTAPVKGAEKSSVDKIAGGLDSIKKN